MMDSGVVAFKTRLGATGCTQPVCRKPRPEHGLGTTRGTLVGRRHSRNRSTTPESIMSLVFKSPVGCVAKTHLDHCAPRMVRLRGLDTSYFAEAFRPKG